MEIKIDTKKDSTDDIKRMIDFLLKFVGENERQTEEMPTLGEGAFNMFGDSQAMSGTKKKDKKDDDDDQPPMTIVEY